MLATGGDSSSQVTDKRTELEKREVVKPSQRSSGVSAKQQKWKVGTCERLSAAFICSCVISEAREAFIKQFSSLEASTGSLVAQLRGVTSALNCSLAVAEGGSTRSEASGKAEGVCQSFTEAALVISRAQKQLQQATLDLDNMVGPYCFCSVTHVRFSICPERPLIASP